MSNDGTFRYAGEFEEQQAVILCWPRIAEPVKGMYTLKVFADIVKALQGHVDIYINCGYEGTFDSCRETLKREGIDAADVHITQYPDIMNWSRDSGRGERGGSEPAGVGKDQ